MLDDSAFAACGYLGTAEIFLDKFFRKLLKKLSFVPVIDISKITKKGDSARIILADAEKVRVYGVVNVFRFGVLNVLRTKKIFETELEKDLVFSIGSGSSEKIDNIALKETPEEAIKQASLVDKYTNDIITKIDVRQLFGA